MSRVTGFDGLQKKLKLIQNAIAELDGDLGTVSFDPNDPTSIDHAIKTMESTIDERLGQYSSDSFVKSLIEETKEKFRSGILQKAAEKRISNDGP